MQRRHLEYCENRTWRLLEPRWREDVARFGYKQAGKFEDRAEGEGQLEIGTCGDEHASNDEGRAEIIVIVGPTRERNRRVQGWQLHDRCRKDWRVFRSWRRRELVRATQP